MFDLFQADGMKNGGFAENLQETACGGLVRSTGCRKYIFYSLFTKAYVYLDHVDYLADSLFVQNKIAVKFQYDMAKDGSLYGMVFCKVRKRDTGKFAEAMEQLNNKMILLGHKDYPEACAEMDQLISKVA